MIDLQTLRTLMAEEGFEYTPRQINSIFKAIKHLKRRLDASPIDYENLDLQDKQEIRRLMSTKGSEVTMQELDVLIELILSIKNM